MLRVTVGLVLALLALAPPAAGAPIGLRDDLGMTAVAVAGDEVLVLRDRHRRGGGAELLAIPRAGGPARTLQTVERARPTWPYPESLAASDQRVAFFVEIEDRRGRTVEWRVYSGPPSGPLEIVRRMPDRDVRTWEPVLIDVDGDRVLLVELRASGDDAVRAQIFDPVSGFVPVPWANRSTAPAAIGGQYAAVYATRPRRIAVADLATRAEHAAVRLPREVYEVGVDVTADGRLVVTTEAGLTTARAGEAPSAVPDSKGLRSALFAGDAITAFQDGRPLLLGADGSRQVLGPPSQVPTDLAADARGVAWQANGCLRYEPLAAPVPAPDADDPCPSTEIGFYLIANSPLRGRHVRVPVRCVTAPTGTCRGTVLGKLGRKVAGRARFAVPVGTERKVRMRVTRAAAARFRLQDGGLLILDARIPDGRIGAGADGSAELGIDVR